MSSNNEREYFVTLLSSDCVNVYTNNNPSAFTTYFNRSLKLQGNWVVGLTEISLNKNHLKPKPIGLEEYYSPIYNNYGVIQSDKNDKEKQDQTNENNENNLYSLIFIYLDIIEPRVVGGQSTKCVRSFIKKNDERTTIEFQNIQYFPLCVNNISDISVLFADTSGRKVNFKPSHLPNIVTLHLKKMD